MDNNIIQKLDTFFSKFPSQTFQKGQALIQAGDEPKGIFYIQEGVVRRYWISSNGNEVSLNLYKPHSFLPMSWAVSNIPNAHVYEALTDVITKRAPKQEVVTFVKNNPDILYDLLRRVYIGMEGLWTHIENMTTGTSYEKLVTALVILTKRFGKEQISNGVEITLRMSEKDLATYAGITRETTNRELQRLKKEGLVSYEKNVIMVHNLRGLEHKLLS